MAWWLLLFLLLLIAIDGYLLMGLGMLGDAWRQVIRGQVWR